MKPVTSIPYLKELLLSAVMLTLVLGPFQPLIAQAQDAAGMASFNATTPQQVIDTSNTVNAEGQAQANSPAGAAQSTAANTQNPGAAPQKQATDAPQCNWTSNWDLCLTNVVYVFTVGIGSGFAYVAAYFFNLAVNLSLNGPAYALTFISTGWTTARDLANMAFLFILIYIAFTIMLEADTHGTMSLLAGVIVIALLVNFSFFFTRVVIDAGNILSIQFYNSITAPSLQASAQTSNVTNTIGAAASIVGASNQSKDLTASIMGMLQLQNLFNTESFQKFYDGNKSQPGGFLVVVVTLSFLYIAAGIMFYLLTVMFVTVGVKFLMRVVVLWFLIIASPLAFVSRAMPKGNKLRGYFDQWRDLLISHAFYPVAFMFIFLILTNFTNQMGNCTNNGVASSQSCLLNDIFTSLPAGTTSSQSAMVAIGLAIANVAIRMGFVIAILYLGMKASDSISVMGSKFAESAGGWVGQGLLKSYNVGYKRVGPGAWIGGADRALKTGEVSASLFGKQLFKFNSTNLAKFGNSAIGYEMRRYGTKPLADTAVPGSHGESYTKMKERQGKEYSETAANVRDAQNKEDLKWMSENTAPYNAAKKVAVAARTAEQQALVDKGDAMKTKIKGLGKRELEGVKFADLKSIASIISESQLKTLKDSEKLSDKQKEELSTDWNTHNSGSAYQKAHKELDELRAIANELHTAGIHLAEIDRHVGGAATAARSSALVNKDIIKDFQKEARKKMAKLDNEIAADTRAGIDTSDKRENKDKLKEAMDHITKLATETGNVQANIGGEKEEGKFRTK